ncbi:MAG: ribosome small subunit-dependent GTPase A [Lachnospiraceae bacterium]|nr:ribosome small subunit-dependent GTPase A [Lachnospiraceae bacterium]MBR4815922.1 ribosome small subunit-dependent GTPase A [Lachnospiraceae bacterium]
MVGKIIKGVAGTYTVVGEDNRRYECKARGIFRKNGITPLVGDNAEFEITHEAESEGNILKILKRKNELIRPACANVDQVLVVFAAADPEPNFNLLDRFLIMMKKQGVDTVICFNKKDIAGSEKLELIAHNYEASGLSIVYTSVLHGEGKERIEEILKGKTTILAGPSGVGKSSMMNMLSEATLMEVGELSEKIKRGKQTTRHTELIEIGEDTFLCDSPGFSSIYLTDIEAKDLKDYYPEFEKYAGECRFLTCNHISEPDCAVKNAVEQGAISKGRYENYCLLYNELKAKKQF